MIFALVLIPLIIGVGAAVDYGRAILERSKLQRGLDQAALTLVRKIKTMSDAEAAAQARLIIAPELSESVNIAALTARYDYDEGALALTGSVDVGTAFMRIWSFDKVTIAAAATAKAVSELRACVIALDPSSARAFQARGNGSVEAPNCGIFANSSHDDALSQAGRGRISAKWIGSVGGYRGGNFAPLPLTGRPPIKDPLETVPEPAAPEACDYKNETLSGDHVFAGGTVFCGSISFAGKIVFNSGIHYFKNSQVQIGSTHSIESNNAVLYFDSNSNFSSTSNGNFKLNAPQSGIYAGIVMFGSRKSHQTFKITGGKDYFVDGTIYLPKAALELYGTADLEVTARSGYVIANTFMYTGNSSFRIESYGGAVAGGLTGDLYVSLIK